MLRLTHVLIVAAYVSAPVAALLLALVGRNRAKLRGKLAVVGSAAVVLGSGLSFVYAIAIGGRISAGQVCLAVYLTASLLLLIMALDWLLVTSLRVVWERMPSGTHAATVGHKVVESMPFLIRATVLIAVALPYLMASALTYRPKVVPRDDPASKFGMVFEPVRFETADGFEISGWWIPALQDGSPRARGGRSTLPPNFGRDTILVCHGIGSNKAAVLTLARSLTPFGYNMLMFDFRAHGESDGQLTSLGDLERQDVLAAVHWVQQTHPRQSRRILGLGVSTGAAALIAAAAEETPQGQAIEAIAVLEGFDDLKSLSRTVAQTRFLPPLSWVADRVGLALASAQVGADLIHFSPAETVQLLWPRPVLFIHGGNDTLIPLEHGRALYDAALEPKRRVWLPNDDYGQVLTSKETIRAVREFFDEARPVPAI